MDWGYYTLELGFSQTTSKWNRVSQTRTATIHGAFTKHTEDSSTELENKITHLVDSLLAIKKNEQDYGLPGVDKSFIPVSFSAEPGPWVNIARYTCTLQSESYVHEPTGTIGGIEVEGITLSISPSKVRIATIFLPQSDGAILQDMGLGLGEVTIQGTYHKPEDESDWPKFTHNKTTTIEALDQSFSGVITASNMRIDSIQQTAELSITISCQPDQFNE